MEEEFSHLEDDGLLAAEDAPSREPAAAAPTIAQEHEENGAEETTPGSSPVSDSPVDVAVGGGEGGGGAGGNARYSQAQLRRSRDLLTRLYAVRRAARFYPMEHPAVAEGVALLLEASATYHSEGVDVRLSFFDGEILLGEQLLTEESMLFDQLIRDMTALGVGSLSILRGVTQRELELTLEVLCSDAASLDAAGGVVKIAEALGLEHVELGSVLVVERANPVTGDMAEQARASYGGAVSLVREIDRLVRVNRHASAGRIKGVVRSLVDNVMGNRYAMLQLTGLKNYDEYTFYHSANVAILSLALGGTITKDYRFLSSLGAGALLHDVGKLSVDLDILNKPGALTPEEWAAMREHPIRGAEMVSLLPGVDKAAIVTILEHHMRYDSTGYPARTPSRRQHLASRIVAVADSYDAMTSRRSYSAARVQDEAMALLMQCAGTSLDPVLVRAFVRLMGVYPPRSVVRLSGGEIAIVIQPSPSDPVRPVVRVIASPSGDFISPVDIDLMREPSISVQGCIDPQHLNIEVDEYLS